MVRQRVSFIGRVQGVGFRATARDIAGRHAVTGWVRNEADGSVLLEVQGAANEIAAFLSGLRAAMGPFIRSEQIATLPSQAAETGFEIRR